MHQHLIRLHQVFERNAFVKRALCQRRPSAADQKNHQREFVQMLKLPQNMTSSRNRLLRRQRMSALKVREPVQIVRRLGRSHHHSFDPPAHLRNQGIGGIV